MAKGATSHSNAGATHNVGRLSRIAVVGYVIGVLGERASSGAPMLHYELKTPS